MFLCSKELCGKSHARTAHRDKLINALTEGTEQNEKNEEARWPLSSSSVAGAPYAVLTRPKNHDTLQ
jgi:uncharacterized protein (DUF2252 family)